MSRVLYSIFDVPGNGESGYLKISYRCARPVRRQIPTMTGAVWSEDIENYEETETVPYSSAAERDALAAKFEKMRGGG
ncbi:hypothetical protein [Bradyrhizobium retamae]|uniref:hypothetical protein n=1 Tax=Bradyrhizobium retamae TaxID=1300035 RepID=UPI000A6E2547|nr:hypothetical protein [Bradyrhizobium retamae]